MDWKYSGSDVVKSVRADVEAATQIPADIRAVIVTRLNAFPDQDGYALVSCSGGDYQIDMLMVEGISGAPTEAE
jgi:hypothetical protein